MQNDRLLTLGWEIKLQVKLKEGLSVYGLSVDSYYFQKLFYESLRQTVWCQKKVLRINLGTRWQMDGCRWISRKDQVC